ncbi:hypothetical protein KY084_04075 [Stakelama sp. CBK3Z-3]|uniref:DUF1376 domain-containing protein n=1 Tax=Stakelama flava TaxID=2860338 RepID=A0ABS6XIN8_9SPHN|nr:hypothetical protein [Stakelama flava]MBW4330050.1 hypothetical protein [Stakelama flava]
MTEDEFKAAAPAHLEQCDERDIEQWAREQPDAEWFAAAHVRWLHAREAFPGMTWEEFGQLEAKRSRQGQRGRPKRSVTTRAAEPLWKAAKDADRIKDWWRDNHTDTPRSRPPLHPHQIAAERHGVSRQVLDEQMKRSNERRMDRKAAQ